MRAKTSPKKLGYYHQSKDSNQRLVKLFEECQTYWYRDPKDWKNKRPVKKLREKEKQARKEILKMLRKGKIRTSDDFYRAAWFFHHGSTFRSYALAVALSLASYHLGELWGKNFYAVALDRFLLSIGQPQYFGTQVDKRGKKWVLAPYNKKTTDKERGKHFIWSLKEALKELNRSAWSKRMKK